MENAKMTRQERMSAIREWLDKHPDGDRKDCMTDLINKMEVGRSTFYDDFKRVQDELKSDAQDELKSDAMSNVNELDSSAMAEKDSAVSQKHPGGRPPAGAGRTERMTIMMTPATKRMLRRMCADDDVTAAEWLERAVAQLYPTYAE